MNHSLEVDGLVLYSAGETKLIHYF